MRSLSVLVFLAAAVGTHAGSRTATLTGWFSDKGCASGRTNSGVYTATNPDCARRCIEKGSPVVFIAETEKAIYVVKDYAAAKDDLGYKIEVTATVDDEGKTIAVQSVKRLEAVVLSCSRAKAK